MSFLNICMWGLWSWAQERSLLSSPEKSVEGCMIDGGNVTGILTCTMLFTLFTKVCFLSFETNTTPLLIVSAKIYI